MDLYILIYVTKYKLINIDNNVDVDNKHITRTEENEQKKELNENEKSISFICNNQNNTKLNDKISNNTSKNKINISFNKKFNINEIKSYKEKNNNIKKNKIKLQINSNNLKFIDKYIKQIKINKDKVNKKAHLLTSLEEKEKIELEECIFQPKINKPKKLFRNNNLSQNRKNSSFNNNNRTKEIQSRFEKLYKDKERYRISKDLKVKENEKLFSKKVTFVPEIKKIRKFKSEGNFEKRQEKFLLNKSKHSAEIKNEIDLLYESICSFNPKITNEKGKYYKIRNKEKIKKPVYLRLYKDVEKRQNNQIQQEIESMNKIIHLSNIMNPERTFDFSTITRLYENKEKINVMNKTKKKVEEDEGITFKPYIGENSYSKSVNRSFYERNQKLMNDKESFIEENKKGMEKTFVANKKYTKEERKIIIENIIKRLYNNPSEVNRNNNKS